MTFTFLTKVIRIIVVFVLAVEGCGFNSMRSVGFGLFSFYNRVCISGDIQRSGGVRLLVISGGGEYRIFFTGVSNQVNLLSIMNGNRIVRKGIVVEICL